LRNGELAHCISGWGEWQDPDRKEPKDAEAAHGGEKATQELHRLIQ
jgi:hypothetical protein